MHIYFQGLKFLRFMAASVVVVHHTEQFKSLFGLQSSWDNGVIRHLGDKGVTLFFVLSGFLISYLLLKEKEKSKTVHIPYFYMRRILRIWPLYFLIVLSSLFILPNIEFFRTPYTALIEQNFIAVLLLSLAILPNVTLFAYGPVPFSSQAWSIGVEEQFYLLWPLLIRYVSKLVPVLLFIILSVFALQNAGILAGKLGVKDLGTSARIAEFFRFFRIDCMAFGSLAAILYFDKHRLIDLILHPIFSWLILGACVLLFASPLKLPLGDNQMQSLLFAALILNVVAPGCPYAVENRTFNFLGDISYGIYMYHPLICFFVIKLSGGNLSSWLIYALIYMLTIFIAYLSYTLFEKPLIQLKSRKYSLIASN